MKVSFYGAINTSDIIRTATTNIFQQGTGLQDSDIQLSAIKTTPNPSTIIGMPDSDFGFLNEITLSVDSS